MTEALRQRIAANDTLPKLLRQNAREYPKDIALREKDLGIWRSWTWQDYLSRVRVFALGLSAFLWWLRFRP